MTFVQLIEFICDRIARCDEDSVSDDGMPNENLTAEDYYKYMEPDIGYDIPKVLRSMIINTIEYIMDNNKYIRGILQKKEMELKEYVKVKEK